MIRSAFISVSGHLLIGLAGLFVWSAAPRSLPVEVVDISLEGIELSETTNLREIVRPDPEPVEEEPLPEEEIVEEAAEEMNEATPEEVAPEISEDPAPDFTEEDSPEPDPTPEPEITPTPKPTPTPTETPVVQKRSDKPPKKSLDDLFSDTEDILQNIKTEEVKRGPKRASDAELQDNEIRARKAAGDRQGNQASVRDFIIAQIKADQCYRSVKDLPDWERLIVTISFQLDSKGRISVPPRRIQPRSIPNYDTYMKQAESRAIRAINLCAPFRLPEEDFELWRNENIELTFDETF